MEKQPTDGILEEFRLEFLDCWRRLPNKGFFFILLAAWLALFQAVGNSTLGFIHSPRYSQRALSRTHSLSRLRTSCWAPTMLSGVRSSG